MGDRPRVAVTRAAGDAAPLVGALEAAGLETVVTPLLQFVASPAETLAQRVMTSAPFDWIACTSGHAVDALVAAAPPGSDPRRRLDGARVGAVGDRTAASLGEHGWPVAVVPPVADAAHLARAMLAADPLPARHVLFPRAREAREELPAILRDAGWTVGDAPCYETLPCPDGAAALSAHLAAGEVQAVVLASGSAARAFAQLVPPALRGAARLVSIGPTTTTAAREAGLVVSAEADVPGVESLALAARRILIELPSHA